MVEKGARGGRGRGKSAREKRGNGWRQRTDERAIARGAGSYPWDHGTFQCGHASVEDESWGGASASERRNPRALGRKRENEG